MSQKIQKVYHFLSMINPTNIIFFIGECYCRLKIKHFVIGDSMMLNKRRNQRLKLFSSKIFVGLVACIAGAWKSWAQERTGSARERHGKERDKERLPYPPRVFLAHSVLSCPHYFQAPATQAIGLVPRTLACAALL